MNSNLVLQCSFRNNPNILWNIISSKISVSSNLMLIDNATSLTALTYNECKLP